MGPTRGPELGRAKRFGCSFQSWHTSCLCSRVRRTDRSPRAQRKFVGSFFDETGIGIDWELSEQICRSAGRAFQAYAERRRKQSDRGSVVSLQTSPLARTHSQTDSVFSPSMSAYIAQPSLVSLLIPSDVPRTLAIQITDVSRRLQPKRRLPVSYLTSPRCRDPFRLNLHCGLSPWDFVSESCIVVAR